MLPALRLPLLVLAALLVSAPAAHAASGLSVAVPAEGQVAVAVAGGVKSVKVKSAPAGVTVAGGVKKGRLAVAVVRPRGVAASGKVVFALRGKAKGVKTFPAALDGGTAGTACKDLAALLGKRLKGKAAVKPLGRILAAKLCGKPAPAGAADVLRGLGLGAPPAPPAPPVNPGTGSLRPSPATQRPAPTPTPTPPAGGKRVCDNGIDDDGDGQTDWEDPGCSDAGDATENSEVPVSAECAASSGVGMADDPTELGAGINGGCGSFYAVEFAVAPGVASCTANNGFECQVFDPIAEASRDEHDPTDMVDVTLQLKGPVQCDKPYTIAFFRSNGQVAELQAPVANCKTLPAPPPKCSNGKDDDGDGMVDSRDAAGTTDPDPGCRGVGDTSEDSEVPAPPSCQIQLGVWNDDPRWGAARADGCGVIKGFWYRPANTPTACAYSFGDEDIACDVKGATVGATFPLTGLTPLLIGADLAADVDCRPMTLALIKDDDTVWFKRKSLDGC